MSDKSKYFIILLMFLYSCHSDTIKSHQLVGEWISIENEKICFSFAEDRCAYIHPYGNFAQYEIVGSTIVISDTLRKRDRYTPKHVEFEVYRVNDSLLTLVTDTATLNTDYRFKNREQLDTIRLDRVRIKYQNEFESLEFTSSRCFGSCQVMKLDIESDGKVAFEGIDWTVKKGYYSGVLSKQQMNKIRRKINYLNLQNMEDNYEYLKTDQQTRKLKIVTRDSTFHFRVYGSGEAPVELRLVFNELIELYKFNEMRKDSVHSFYADYY